jgi:eukaryotic-like serine/threonine-protein kinase
LTIAAGTHFGRYEIRAPIGEGGMGEVYLALDTQLDRSIALKILTADVARDPQRLHRFLQEARAASALSHPNVAHIYEIGEAQGTHFIAMEYVEGEGLDKKIGGRPLEVNEILEIAIQIADALDEAHSKGIIHRDIKSSNIMIAARGRVKVLDFGLAKLSAPGGGADLTSDSQLATRVKTSPGIVMGTVNYMSPEQAMGREVDQRTDIFSFGVVLYEMSTGRLPFSGATITETIDRISHSQPEAIARLNYSIPPELEVVVKKALRKDRDDRYQTVHDLLVDLRELKRDIDVAASLERSTPPSSHSIEVPTQIVPQSVMHASAASGPPASPTVPVTITHPTSSAEFVAGEIKRHKSAVVMMVIAVVLVVGVGLSLIGFGIYKYTARKGESKTNKPGVPANMKISRLTTNGKTVNAAISPDGKTVVYVVAEGGKNSLWIRQVATSSNVQIVTPSEADIGRETFSPDGNYVYYRAQDKENPGGALYQVPSLGGTPRKILSNIVSPITFSPDGNRIAFVRNDNAATGEDQMIIANADGSNEHKLAARKGDRFFTSSGPGWSPDGKTIACSAGAYAGGFHLTIVGVNTETGEQKDLTSKKFFDTGRISWLADGSAMVMNAAELGASQSQIWLFPYPDGEPHPITHDLNDYGGTSLTADSNSLVTVQFDVNSNVWIAPANDLSHGKQITSGKLEGHRGVVWTPDNRVVYTSLASGNLDLWIMNSDGSNKKQLTNDASWDDSPRVSPDGRYILFNSLRGALPSIWRMDVDGGNLKQLTNQEDYLLDISPDGSWLAFTTWRTGKMSMWRVSIDGGEPTKISDLFIAEASISPDGKTLACWYQDEKPNSPRRLIILPVEGGPPKQTFDMPPTSQGRPSWSADGKTLTIYDSRTGTNNLWILPLDGGPMKQLTDFKPDSLYARDLSGDGKFMALARGTINSDVILISNFK